VADLGPFAYLDAAATVDPTSKTLTLCIINRHQENSTIAALMTVGGSITGSVQVYEVNGRSSTSVNSFDDPNAVGIREGTIQAARGKLNYRFPAHSVTVLKAAYE
jgi:alpha-L-arabinofuranosidase